MKSYKIILVDDHPMVRRGIRTFLEEESSHIVAGEAGDGFALLKLLTSTKPDLILLDITLPELSGIELIPEVLKIRPETKILILTMHKNEQYLCSAFRAGASGFLLKEDSDTELLKAIDDIMSGNIVISTEFEDFCSSNDILSDCLKQHESSSQITLSPREEQILKLICKGFTNKKIGEILSISKRTVETHRASLMKRLQVNKVADLVRYAIAQGYIDPSE
ncbi:MAG TPA: response regulator transcription factor [Desulfocapsa sulfexigens]|nr:response regulator transcription factor [Desulfocapsa sulfexigens]